MNPNAGDLPKPVDSTISAEVRPEFQNTGVNRFAELKKEADKIEGSLIDRAVGKEGVLPGFERFIEGLDRSKLSNEGLSEYGDGQRVVLFRGPDGVVRQLTFNVRTPNIPDENNPNQEFTDSFELTGDVANPNFSSVNGDLSYDSLKLNYPSSEVGDKRIWGVQVLRASSSRPGSRTLEAGTGISPKHRKEYRSADYPDLPEAPEINPPKEDVLQFAEEGLKWLKTAQILSPEEAASLISAAETAKKPASTPAPDVSPAIENVRAQLEAVPTPTTSTPVAT